MSDQIQFEKIQRGLVGITLNRPERRNALSIELLELLCDTLEALAGDGETRVVILSGSGPVFSSGLDLQQAADSSLVERIAQCMGRALRLMRQTSLVSIAAAHGGAYAGGAGLMAACDIAIGASDLLIAFPEARRGLLPALICSVLCTKLREGDLRELFLVGNTLDAQRALNIGLVQRVVPRETLKSAALEIAKGVLAGGPNAIIETKRLLNQAFSPSPEVSIEHMLDAHLAARNTEEAIEGLAAFHQKRLPKWHAS
jgi:methylglutaconyl-CoA hydratase